MKTLTVTFLGIFAVATVAAKEVDRTLDAASDGTVSISNIAGSIEVAGWSRSQVHVTGELGDDVDELIFERSGKDIEIKVKSRRRNSRNVSSDLHVKVPQRSSVEVNTVSADIDIEGVLGEQSLESVSGDITTEAHDADIDINTVSGDLEIAGDKRNIRSRLSSVSGDVDADKLAGEVAVESVSGDLFVTDGVFQRASLNTVNGDIVFRAQLLDDGRLDVETVNGGVEIAFAGDVSARFDIETFNGDIDNCFGPEPVRVSKYAPGYELKFTEGGGNGRVRIETLNGDLNLCK